MPEEAPLEDLFEDVVAKAQKGLGLTHRNLSEALKLPLEQVRKLSAKTLQPAEVDSLADILNLAHGGLRLHHDGEWSAPTVELPGVQPFRESFYEGVVNSYLLCDSASETTIVFDGGITGKSLLSHLHSLNHPPSALFLTHLHRDHTGILKAFSENWPDTPIHAPIIESSPNLPTLPVPSELRIGPFLIEARPTPGHSPGGTSYLIHGGKTPLCVVGDALFAGSVGGCSNAYDQALTAIREKILCLPPATTLLPGHGPPTTVAHERKYNPFFPNLSP